MAPSSPTAPPAILTTPLELDPRDWSERDAYHLVTGLVVPRPIAWVSTVDPDGVLNLAPHSFFNLVAHDPLHVVVSSTGVKDTLRNLRRDPGFVLNIVTMDLLAAMNATSIPAPPEFDEFEFAGLEAAPAVAVRAPRVAAAPAHLECEVRDELEVGGAHLVIAEVLHVHVDPRIWRDGRIDTASLAPVGRLAGSWYLAPGDLVRLPRPRWEDGGEQPPSLPEYAPPTPAVEAPPDDDRLAELATALAHPARVQILRHLATQQAGTARQVVEQLPLGRSTVSEHLRILHQAGLVETDRFGTDTVHRLAPAGLAALQAGVAMISQPPPAPGPDQR